MSLDITSALSAEEMMMGKRGEGWVIGQFIIGALILLAPPGAPLPGAAWLPWLGLLVGALGALILALATGRLGENLTAFPKPIEEGVLVQTGLYGVVRHPIYLGVLLGALGWALFRQSLPALALTFVLALWLDAKSRREEGWLAARYPDYEAYRKRLRQSGGSSRQTRIVPAQ